MIRQSIGPYQIVAKLGEGGMGEVYRATDTRLKRDVALKILPENFATDPERLARFQREAQVLASLNHPNIAAIHGLEESNSTRALVMELVEGETLADRIARGPIPVDEALPIAKQIAEALEAAHERGIIHRDLKPANIKLRPDGTVKVLDFGLAKALEPAIGVATDVSQSPTITSPAMMTSVGTLLGTAAYMSPEQARGKPVHKRADIWAFGCVLYEMLTGTRAFGGSDVAETIGAVIHKDPPWGALPVGTPGTVRTALQRCLEKDPKRRIRDIGDVQLALSGAFDTQVPPSTVVDERSRPWLATAIVAVLVVAAGSAGTAWWLLRSTSPPRGPVRFAITPSESEPLNIHGFFRQIAVSPTGAHVAYVTGSADSRLMIRGIDEIQAAPLRGSTGAGFPFFSPDGRWIGFFTGGSGDLKKMPIAGGAPVTICHYVGTPRGASWGPDGTIVFATNDTNTGLLSVSSDGGEPAPLTKPDPAKGEQDHWMPSFSPDGRVIFFTVSSENGADSAQVAALDLRTGERKTLIRGGSDAVYVEAPGRSQEDAFLVYGYAGTLKAARFDLSRLLLVTEPVSVVERVVMLQTAVTNFGISRDGTLVYVPGDSSTGVARALWWVSRDGTEQPLNAPRRPYTSARLSPDGTRVVLAVSDEANDVWIYDIGRHSLTRLTTDPNLDNSAIWSVDGQRIFFTSARSGPPNIYSQRADGTGVADRLTTSASIQGLGSFSPDGRLLVFHEGNTLNQGDVMVLRLDPRPHVEPLLQTSFSEGAGEVSPDGRYIAYHSNESGRDEVYVRPFPMVEGGGRWTISNAGGSRPAWSRDGKELFYFDATRAMMMVPIQATPTFSAGTPTKLFDGPWYAVATTRPYDVSRDGQRFLMIRDTDGANSGPATMTVVVNWFEELKRLVPVN
jgi:serine/threonine-protein kinase